MERETKFNVLRGIIMGSCLDNEQKQELVKFVTELEESMENVTEEYINPNEVTIEHLMEILKSYEPDAIVVNGKEENIKIYPGRKVAPADGSVIMIC